MAIDTQATVRDLVRNNPAAVGVFESLGIEYCCGGNKPLHEACAAKGLPVSRVLAELEEALRLPPIEEDCHWLTCPLNELTAHIVSRHHDYSRRQLLLLSALAAKVSMRHGTTKPEYGRLQELVNVLAAELSSHMLKEEEVLFPIVDRMQQTADAGRPLDSASPGLLLHPIRHMMEEHDDAGELLKAIRSVTNNFELNECACTTLRAFYAGLKDHEEDLHRHIHLENNILFPRALEMARKAAERAA